MVPTPREVVEQVFEAQNAHDLDGMLEHIAPDYRSETPTHPARNFTGREHVRENWTTLFDTTPDLETECHRIVEAGDEVWAEIDLTGTQTDGANLEMRGVVIFGVSEDRIEWGRIYLEPVERDSETWTEFYAIDEDSPDKYRIDVPG